MLEAKALQKFINHQDWVKAGSPRGGYWITKGQRDYVILSCPYCDNFSSCTHEIICKQPLTLCPSVIEHNCGHHFAVENGFAR